MVGMVEFIMVKVPVTPHITLDQEAENSIVKFKNLFVTSKAPFFPSISLLKVP